MMFIHSGFGVLECKPMTLQAIENSISESELIEQNQVFEGEPADAVEPQAEDSDSPN